MPERTCSVEGCDKAHRARGYCSTHYNQQLQPQRHAKVTMPCGWCKKPCEKEAARANRYGAIFCDIRCRDLWRRRQADLRKLPVVFVGDVMRPLRPVAAPAAMKPPLPPRRWVAGQCRRCGGAFIDRQPDARYCSERCCRRYWRDQYKDEVPHAVRLRVLERDGWRCQICRRGIPVGLAVPDPRAATVDHVVPRSQGGSHDPANLRAAHFRCNSLRSNRGGGEQLALIG